MWVYTNHKRQKISNKLWIAAVNFSAIHKYFSMKKIHKKCSFQIVNVCMYVFICVCVCVCVCVCCFCCFFCGGWGGGSGSDETSLFLNFEKLHRRLLHQSPSPLQLNTKSSSSKTATAKLLWSCNFAHRKLPLRVFLENDFSWNLKITWQV